MIRSASSFSTFSRPSAMSSAKTSVWWRTSNMPSNCGYSFFIVLKQCGQVVITFCTPVRLNVSMFWLACIW